MDFVIHEIKIETVYYEAIAGGEKTFEIRFNDRNYQKGDLLRFIDSIYRGVLSGIWEITNVHSGFGLKEGFVSLSIKQKKGE